MTDVMEKQLRLYGSINRFLDNVKKIGRSNLTAAKLRSRITALKELWLQYQDGHDHLARITSTTDQKSFDYFKDSYYEAAEDTFHDTLDQLTERLEKFDPVVSPNQSFFGGISRADAAAVAFPVLPAIQLPNFSGDYSDWEHFRDRFTTLIRENKELTNYSRMHYLVSCLKGRALDCISDLAITSDNFVIAWHILTARFEKTQRLVHVHLDALLNLPAVRREQASELQFLLDQARKSIAALTNLNRNPGSLWNDFIVHVIVKKLDPITRKAWNLKESSDNSPTSYEQLVQFLTQRPSALEYDTGSVPCKLVTNSGKPSRVHATTASAASTPQCPLCKREHFFYTCSTFVSKIPCERRSFIQNQKRCFNCLSAKHSVKDCQSKFSCRACKKRHHSLLHTASDDQKAIEIKSLSSSSSQIEQNVAPIYEASAFLASIPPQPRSQVLLATAWVRVESAGRTVVARALLDQGSERTFINESLAQTLQVKRERAQVSVSGVGDTSAGIVRTAASINIYPRLSPHPKFNTTALILQTLTAYHPRRASDISSFAHLADLELADAFPFSSDPISLIIGADLYSEIILEGIRKGKSDQPIAQNSALGWIISGPIDSAHHNSVISSGTVRHDSLIMSIKSGDRDPLKSNSYNHVISLLSLAHEIQRFWESEEIPREIPLSAEDERCEKHFCNTHTRDETGRYIVRLPFKRDPPIDIGESRTRAERMLNSLRRKLAVSPASENSYREFMTEYETLGHMRLAPTFKSMNCQTVYLPHHAVIRKSSTTTRLRVVFNASSVTSNGSTLNNHLLSGPKSQTDIVSVLLQWRQHRYVYVADITKMYRQIRVDHRDLYYQRILWFKSEDAEIQEFQLLTVTYGMACAPFLALRVLKQLVQDEGSRFPLAVPVMSHNIYIDDLLFGDDDIQRIGQTRDQVRSLLRCGGFELKKWASNSASLLAYIDKTEHCMTRDKLLKPDARVNILRINWNPIRDAFVFCVSLDEKLPSNKRAILSTIAKLYDPLGWVTPVVISAKIFMQSLWHANLTWDEPLPSELRVAWHSIYSKLASLHGLQIARWTGLTSTRSSCTDSLTLRVTPTPPPFISRSFRKLVTSL
ncbi:uncharacterized protein LOC116853403 [Odontomachus brunneus]|uniref:uncharacterized protein LOC116853403 n=1 Tax=Odontomachus brunneus TaxID=486640 RepID=UPI0013F1D020|nr:uncharacterized protein LOC116853403 [Odontomachus brunneus]